MYGRSFLNEAESDQKSLIEILRQNIGIYAFYNSEFEIIYLGKTKNSLWNEMKSAYMRTMPHYKRYRVKHPRGKFLPPKSGSVRKIKLDSVAVWEAASYFSAYSVAENLIDDVEKLLIRIAPNDVLNRRMEGNGSLDSYAIEQGKE